MVSYEHLVVMDELINQIRSITSGIATDVDSLALDAIAQCNGPEGNFFAAEHTMQFMKRNVYYSEFCGRIETPYEDFYEKERRCVSDILARRHTTVHVDKDVLARLEAVEARLKEDDQTWREGQENWWVFYLQDLK